MDKEIMLDKLSNKGNNKAGVDRDELFFSLVTQFASFP